MGVIYPNRGTQLRRAQPSKQAKVWRIVILALACFIGLNLFIALIYQSRTYPRTSVAGVNIGNATYSSIEKRAKQLKVLPEKITLTYKGKSTSGTLDDLGISVDTQRTQDSLAKSRSWLPIVNLFVAHRLDAPVNLDALKLQTYGEKVQPTFHEAPTNAKLSLRGGTFSVEPGKDGYDLSIARLETALLHGIDAGKSGITAPVTAKAPVYTTAKATTDAKRFQASSNTPLNFKASSGSFKATPSDIASWYQPSGNSYSLNDLAIRSFVLAASIKAGTRPSNLADATTKVKQAIAAHQALTFTLIPYATTRTYHYCLDTKGVDAANLKTLAAVAQQTFNDPRGWGLEGQVIFAETDATSGACDFTIWLSRADLLPTFGAICDPEWNCRSGPNVVINYTRWQETSPAWKRYGGSVSDYRSMAINHETGHWFGFEHSTCPSAGQPAPVMMQQSIDLGGCVFNPWPTSRELSVYRSVVGL